MDWLTIVLSAIGGGGLTSIAVAIINKRRTPYDMMCDLIQQQREWMERQKDELDAERICSAEKSYVIAKTRLCEARRTNPSLECPVDDANDERLKKKCETCKTTFK